MFGSSTLEVAMGVVFVYLFVSLICTAVNEGISSMLNKRGKNLLEGIKNLLNDPQFTGLAKQVYAHGLVGTISRNAAIPGAERGLPSYMPSKIFALSMIDILSSTRQGDDYKDKQAKLDAAVAMVRENASPENQQKLDEAKKDLDAAEQAIAAGRAFLAGHPDPLGEIQKAVAALPEGHTKQSLLVLIDKTRREAAREAAVAQTGVATADHEVEKFQANLEAWFNDSMDRTAGWYKRWTQKVVLAIAVVLVLLGNVDSFMLARRFLMDNAVRASLVAAAEKTVTPAPGVTAAPPAANAKDLLTAVEQLDLPIGWAAPTQAAGPTAALARLNAYPTDLESLLVKLAGLITTVLAASLGAPFWFDVLSKIVNLRSAGTPPKTTAS